MAMNTSNCSHLMPLRFKLLNTAHRFVLGNFWFAVEGKLTKLEVHAYNKPRLLSNDTECCWHACCMPSVDMCNWSIVQPWLCIVYDSV